MVDACDPEIVSFHWICAWPTGQRRNETLAHLTVLRIGPSPRESSRIGRLLFGLDAIRFLSQHRHEYDLVYCPSSYWPTELIALAARIFKMSVITRVAKSELATHHMGGWMRSRILPRLANATVVLNRQMALELQQTVSADRIVFIPNGVDTARFHPPTAVQRLRSRQAWDIAEQDILILFVGLIVPYKGVDVALRAFRTVAQTYPTSRLLLAGPLTSSLGTGGIQTDYVSQLYAFAQQSKLSHRVRFLGQVSKIESLLQVADLFVFPSYSEGMPNALLEAMATGLPCVASDIPGVHDLIEDGVNGLLFPAGHDAELAKHIHRLVANVDERQRFGQQARATIDQGFSVRTTARRYQDLFVAQAAQAVR